MKEEWKGFFEGEWNEKINVNNFIINNIKPYEGNEEFLQPISDKTKVILEKVTKLLLEEQKKGVLGIYTKEISGINNFPAGYIDKPNEVIYGLQTDEPLKRIINPFGGYLLAKKILEDYNISPNSNIEKTFSKYFKSHNQGVFDVYSDEIKSMRRSGILTGLPDAYGRGRIIGDYRRISLYGVDYLIEEKNKDFENIKISDENSIRLKEEVSDQIKALNDIKAMALVYGKDISKPAKDFKEAVQWLYFGYLAAVKENNGAAMSLGRTSSFLDIYAERDLNNGKITEGEVQEIVDQFIIKLRLVRHLRSKEYDELFAGDPTWVTESIGGISKDGKNMVTKMSYRYLHTLENLGPSPEPNITILWSKDLPENFKKYATYISIKTGAIQYENDDIMRPLFGDDYGIACCVSAMKIGSQSQYFGARCNLPKMLLYAINGGVDEVNGERVIDGIEPIEGDSLNYNEVVKKLDIVLEKAIEKYVEAMNTIHYMHDKYAYEKSQMALIDTNVERFMAFGIAGLSVIADSMSAIKYGKVKVIRDDGNLAFDYETEDSFPFFGNDDNKVDKIAVEIVEKVYKELCKHKLYRNAKHTLSILTITSNVVYGKKTGSTPDGRKKGEPFAPGVNPMHNRDLSGALASLNSVAKISYEKTCLDGISYTLSLANKALGSTMEFKKNNLISLIDGYFKKSGHHLNINVIDREKLLEAMEDPTKYPNLTIRVSGYAVHFNRLTKEQQEEVVSRTFHESI